MTRPEDAVGEARERAAAARARGEYSDDLEGFTVEPVEVVTRDRLLEWSLIEPDPQRVLSTRRLGAPITALKRLLVRGLRQQSAQLSSDQTRFNMHMVVYASALEERVAELEARIAELEGRRGGSPPAS